MIKAMILCSQLSQLTLLLIIFFYCTKSVEFYFSNNLTYNKGGVGWSYLEPVYMLPSQESSYCMMEVKSWVLL